MRLLIRSFAIIVAAVFILSGTAFAAGTEITRTIDVKNKQEVPNTISEDGKQYKLKNVSLKSIEEMQDVILRKDVTVSRINKNLTEMVDLFPASEIAKTNDGYIGTVYKKSVLYDVDQEHSVFGRTVEIKKEVDHGYVYETPDPEPYIEQDYFDVITNYFVHVKVPYVKTVKVGSGWYPARFYTLEFAADKDGRYYLPKSQEILNVNGDVPGAEYSKDIIWLLGLEADHYRVVASSWKNKTTQNKQETRRTANFEIEERGQKYVSQYARTLDVPVIPRYTSIATYKGTAIKTIQEINPATKGLQEATAVYEIVQTKEIEQTISPTEPPIQPINYIPFIVAGAAAAATTGGIIIILLWRRSRNLTILQWDDEAQAYRIIKRLRVIMQEPIVIDVTRYTAEKTDVFVQLKKKFVDRTGDRNILILNGVNEISANKVVENGYTITKIS